MLKALHALRRTPTRGARFTTTPFHPPANRLSGRPFSTALVVVKAMKVPKTYNRKTFNKKDPATAQLLIENATRLAQDTMNFTGRVLTRVTGTLRKHKRQHRLGPAAMRHILARHSPRHFAGKFKSKENFFPEDITVAKINALVSLVYRNGRRMQRRRPKPGEVVDKTFFQMTGRVNGVVYVLGLHGPNVVQFYPKKDSVAVPGPTMALLALLRARRKPILAAAPEKE